MTMFVLYTQDADTDVNIIAASDHPQKLADKAEDLFRASFPGREFPGFNLINDSVWDMCDKDEGMTWSIEELDVI